MSGVQAAKPGCDAAAPPADGSPWAAAGHLPECDRSPAASEGPGSQARASCDRGCCSGSCRHLGSSVSRPAVRCVPRRLCGGWGGGAAALPALLSRALHPALVSRASSGGWSAALVHSQHSSCCSQVEETDHSLHLLLTTLLLSRLEGHSTCPVCRKQLPAAENNRSGSHGVPQEIAAVMDGLVHGWFEVAEAEAAMQGQHPPDPASAQVSRSACIRPRSLQHVVPVYLDLLVSPAHHVWNAKAPSQRSPVLHQPLTHSCQSLHCCPQTACTSLGA